MCSSYDGNKGATQHTAIKDVEIGCKDIRTDSLRHLIESVSRHEYMESLRFKLTRQASQVLDTFLHKWDWENCKNPNLEGGKEREAAWITYFHDVLTEP